MHVDDFCKLYSLTMNNLGCYYKKVFKPNVALKYMKQALEKEEESNQPRSHIASTKLNICAILSQLIKHQQAIDYANSAVRDLLTTLRIVKIKNLPTDEEKKFTLEEDNLTMETLNIPESNEQALNQTLGIAYYNLAVEYEHIHDYETARRVYYKSLQFSRLAINTEQLQSQINRSLKEVNRKIQANLNLAQKRGESR